MARSPQERAVLGPAVLVGRAAVLSVVTTALALGAHVLAVAMMPTPRTLLAAVLAGLLIGPLLGRGERGVPALLGLLGASQVGLHAWFTVMPSVAMAGHHLAYGGGRPVAILFMVMTHGLATIGVAVWLARCEALLWSLLRALGSDLTAVTRALVLFAATAPHPVPTLVTVTSPADRLPRPATHLRSVPLLRGPPRCAVVAAAG